MRLKVIEDIIKQEYVALAFDADGDFYASTIGRHLDALRAHLGDFYHTAVSNKHKRDGEGHWHVTVFDSMECKKNSALLRYKGLGVDDLVVHGLGSISRDGMSTYYISVGSTRLDRLRLAEHLPPRNWHITLAFDPKDLFHASKDSSTVFAVLDEQSK